MISVVFFGCFAVQAFGLNFDTAKCNVDYGCVRQPSECDPESTCEVIATFTRQGDYVEFLLAGRFHAHDTKEYAAIGFSKDQAMGEDAVTACYSDGAVRTSFNVPDIKDNILNEFSQDTYLIPVDSGAENQMFWCRFRQSITRNEQVANKDVLYEFTEPHYLLLANGPVNGDGYALSQHRPAFPSASATAVDVTGIVGAVSEVIESSEEHDSHEAHAEPTAEHEPEPASEPELTPISEPGQPNLPTYQCDEGLAENDVFAPSGRCQDLFCYVKTMSAFPRNQVSGSKAAVGCDSGALCAGNGCFERTNGSGRKERYCCCQGDRCAIDYTNTVFNDYTSAADGRSVTNAVIFIVSTVFALF